METLSREQQIRKIVKTVRDLGFNKRQTREAVIDWRGAFKKGILKKELDVAKLEHVVSVAKSDLREESREVKKTAIDKYFRVVVGKSELILEIPHPQTEHGLVDISEAIRQRTGATLVVSKKDGHQLNANAPWWMGVDKNERSRSARAALFWVYDDLFSRGGLLDEDSKLKRRVHRVILIGIDRDKPFDLTLATNYNPADRERIEKLKQLIEGKTEGLRVTLAGEKDDCRASDYSGYSNISCFRRSPTEEVNRHHPAFGVLHNTFQIGINKRIRENEELMRKATSAISDALVTISEQ